MDHKQELSYARRGLGWGVTAGATWGLDSVLLAVVFAMAPFNTEASIFVAPLVVACLHDGLAAIWLCLYDTATGKWREVVRTLKTRPGLMVCVAAFFGGPIAMSGYALAIKFAGTAYAMSISAIFPALGAILGVIFLKEKISLRAWIGIALCITGTIVVAYQPGQPQHFYLGVAFALLAAFGWACEGVFSTCGMDLLDPDIATTVREGLSFLVFTAIVLPIIGGLGMLRASFLTPGMGVLAFTALIGSISYLTWYRAMNMTGVGRAMALNITFALWSIVFGLFFTRVLGIKAPDIVSEINNTLIMGALLTTIGATLVVINPKELINLRKVE